MKDLTTNQKLFSGIVMFLETSIEHPYLKTRDVGSFDELAEALNVRGHRNSRGQRLTGKGITKFISRFLMKRRGNTIQNVWIQPHTHFDGRKPIANRGWHSLMLNSL